MMRYELEDFMKPFFYEVNVVIETDSDEEGAIPTDVMGAKYYMDAHGTGHIKLVPASVLTRKTIQKAQISGKTEDALEALKKLIDFIEKNNMEDGGCDDGDGYYDTWQSDEFKLLIERAKEVIGC